MKSIPIAASILALTFSALAEELEKPETPRASNSSTGAIIKIDGDGGREMRLIAPGTKVKPGKGQLNEDEAEPKTWLGVVLNELSPAVASQLPIDPGTGLIVEHVTPESPAAKAGLQRHDVLVRLGDQVLIAPKQFQTLVANRKAGDHVDIALLRKGQPQTVTATIAAYQPGDAGDHKAAINLYDTKIDLDRLIKDASDAAGSIILNKKTVFVGPDGKPVTIDSDEIRERTLKMLKESGLTRDIIDQVKRAISEAQEQVRKAQEQAKQAAQQAQIAAEHAVKEFQQGLEKSRSADKSR